MNLYTTRRQMGQSRHSPDSAPSTSIAAALLRRNGPGLARSVHKRRSVSYLNAVEGCVKRLSSIDFDQLDPATQARWMRAYRRCAQRAAAHQIVAGRVRH